MPLPETFSILNPLKSEEVEAEDDDELEQD